MGLLGCKHVIKRKNIQKVGQVYHSTFSSMQRGVIIQVLNPFSHEERRWGVRDVVTFDDFFHEACSVIRKVG